MSAASAGRVVSRPLRAPARFNLVGLRWRGRSEPRVSVRVRRDGRRWSRWQALDAHADHNPDPRSGERAVAASDPLWVGEADQVQYTLSRRVPALRLHFVNVNGTATARERVATTLRRAANTRGHGGDRRPQRRRGARAGGASARGQPRGLGRGQVQAASEALVRNGARGVRAPHGLAERLHAGGGAGDRARDLPLPPQLERVERHRLPGARGQVRRALRGPRRGPRQAGAGRARPGLQRPGHRHREHRRQHRRRALRHGARLARRLHPLEAHDPRAAAHRVHHAHERRRRHQPLPGRPPRARSARARAPRHQQHRLPGLRALLPAGRPAQPRGHRRGAAGRGHLPDRLAVQVEHAATAGRPRSAARSRTPRSRRWRGSRCAWRCSAGPAGGCSPS